MAIRTFSIDVSFDKESERFVGISKDIKGLVLEAETFGRLMDEARDVIPHLLVENSQFAKDDEIVIAINIHRSKEDKLPRQVGRPSPRYIVEDRTDIVYA